MEAMRREAFKSFVKTEQDYNLRLLCASDHMKNMIEEFLQGDIPVETLVEIMTDMANQIREDGEDRLVNLNRFINGKISYPMWYGSWKD